MNRTRPISAFVRNFLTLMLAAHAVGADAEPFTPTSDSQVLERLRPVILDPAARQSRVLRSALATDPGNPQLAAALVRHCLERSRAEGDPRHLGHAQAALTPWWNQTQPPGEILVLRATIKQSQHDFASALTDLELAAQLAPDHPQAWLTRATVLTVLGRYDEARQSCLPLARVAPGLLSVTAAASIGSLTGGAVRGCELLRATLDGSAAASASERLWALTVLAETAARLGRAPGAEAAFRRALDLDLRDVYLLGAFADFLLDQNREREVVNLLKDEIRADALLLRLALAEAALSPMPKTLSTHISTLRARFEASRVRGDETHAREEARFTLHLLRQPDEALRLAQQNWQTQREPADARVLLEAALAAQNPGAASPVLEFIQRNRLEDVQLAELAAKLNSLARK